MATGTVRRLMQYRGFGFIARRGEPDLFFHFSAVAPGIGFDESLHGRRVEFDVEHDKRSGRLQAVNVRPAAARSPPIMAIADREREFTVTFIAPRGVGIERVHSETPHLAARMVTAMHPDATLVSVSVTLLAFGHCSKCRAIILEGDNPRTRKGELRCGPCG